MMRVFKVPTIHCQGCVESIKLRVMRLPGMREFSGDPRGKTVTVVFEEAHLNEERIREAIRQAGHEVSP